MPRNDMDENPHPREWDDVDEYITHTLIPQDAAFDGVHEANAAAGLPAID